MKYGKGTKIYDFSFNAQSKSKFKIKGTIQSTDSGEISTKKSEDELSQNKIWDIYLHHKFYYLLVNQLPLFFIGYFKSLFNLES